MKKIFTNSSKKQKNIFKIIIVLVIIMLFILGFILWKNDQESKIQKRYLEIKENVKNAVERNIRASYPGCSISKEFPKTKSFTSYYNSSFLINNGYIQKSELLDIDNESYCDVYVGLLSSYENPLDHQHNCKVYYKIYLKCKNYEDKGYINWE